MPVSDQQGGHSGRFCNLCIMKGISDHNGFFGVKTGLFKELASSFDLAMAVSIQGSVDEIKIRLNVMRADRIAQMALLRKGQNGHILLL